MTSAYAAPEGQPLPATDVPDIPPPVASGEVMEPEVTIVETEKEILYEYRVNGVRYMVKIQPKIGPAYYLVDSDGDGTLDVREDDPHNISLPKWILLSW